MGQALRALVPGSASNERAYKGSRQPRQRYEYAESFRAVFVELSPDHVMNGDELFEALAATPDVESVAWKTSKTFQGNIGYHYMERNILVYVSGSARTPIEFQLTRKNHMKDMPRTPFTVTALFKEPPRH